MNVSEIVKLYLYSEGYDGLMNQDGECGCPLDDFAPCCNGPCPECVPARAKVLGPGEHDGISGPGDTVYFPAQPMANSTRTP